MHFYEEWLYGAVFRCFLPTWYLFQSLCSRLLFIFKLGYLPFITELWKFLKHPQDQSFVRYCTYFVNIFSHFVARLFIYLIMSFFFNVYLFTYFAVPGLSCSMWDLIPWPGIEPGPPTLGAQSLSPWTSREIPVMVSFDEHMFLILIKYKTSVFFLLWLLLSVCCWWDIS